MSRSIAGAVIGCVVLSITFTSAALEAQEAATDRASNPAAAQWQSLESPKWGPANQQALAIQALEFFGEDQDDHAARQIMLHTVYCSGQTFCRLVAGVHLPQGALVTAIEVDAFDGSPSREVKCLLRGCPVGNDGCGGGEHLTTGRTFQGGNTMPWLTLETPVTINNSDYSYLAHCIVGISSNDVRLRSFRIYYEMQISPAPDTATFSDVPTDFWAFREIEALVASGITVGCGEGIYCPDDPVNRAQMAAFLARALGLHW